MKAGTVRKIARQLLNSGLYVAFFCCLSGSLIPGLQAGFSLFAAPARSTVIVELFTSQGCSSCPPADRALARLFRQQPVRGVEIIALGEHVDYWNYLGWKDIFSSPLFSQRQKQYAAAFGSRRIYTPQMIVGGRYELIGNRYDRALEAIQAAASQKAAAHISIAPIKKQGNSRVRLKISARAHRQIHLASLYLAVAERNMTTHVKRGENAGHRLGYSSVVRYLKVLGPFQATAGQRRHFQHTLKLNSFWQSKRLMYVSFLQSNASRHILASAVRK